MSRPFISLALFLGLLPLAANACPFCTAEQSTLTEELANCDAAVIARLIRPAPSMEEQQVGPIDPDAGKSGFEIDSVLLGETGLDSGAEIEALYFGEPDQEALYLIRATGEPLIWAIPLRLTETAVDYVKHLHALPESGPGRISFFLDYLQHEDTMLSQDAYDEFARAPYADLKGIKDQINRERILAWIEDPKVSPSRKRLFLTMLSVCGSQEDIPRLEAMLLSDSRTMIPAAECLAAASITAGGPIAMLLTTEVVEMDERRKKLGLDAMIACYLSLRGPEGLDVIDQRFLSTEEVAGKTADYSHIYSAVMALRFLGEESDIVPMDRVLKSTRLLLDSPDFADQVIPDLARWEDWSVLERLTELYQQAGEPDSGVQKFVREPIITYLDVAAEQQGDIADRADAALAEIEKLDPEAVRRARSLRAFGFLGRARSQPPQLADDPPEPAGLSVLGDDPVVLAEDVASDDIPDPSSFGAAPNIDDAPAAEAPTPEATAPPAKPDPSPWVAAKAPPTPSAAVLIAVPTLAGVVCFGLFWVILRGGGV